MVELNKDWEYQVETPGEIEHAGGYAGWFWETYINYNLNAASGDTTLQLAQAIPENGRVRAANAILRAEPYNSTLRNFAGTSVSASGVEYVTNDGVVSPVATGESHKAFVIDFGGIRKLSAIAVPDEFKADMPSIVLVLPWMGVGFGETPLFPFAGELQLAPLGSYGVSFSEVESAKLFVQFSADIEPPAEPDKTRIDKVLDKLIIHSNTMPLNVRAAVGNRPPFHTIGGEMKGKVPLPEFSAEVNAYLDDMHAAGMKETSAVPLMITMDAPGSVVLDDFTLVTDRESYALWGESRSLTLKFDRQGEKSLALRFPTNDAGSWRVTSLSLEISHDFPPWYTFPQTLAPVDMKIQARVSSAFNLAQCLVMNAATELYGLGIYTGDLENDAEFLLELVTDENGMPGVDVLLEQAVTIHKDAGGNWLDILFDKPFATGVGDVLWLVLKSKTGDLPLVLQNIQDPQEKPALFSHQGSGYKRFPYQQGELKLLHQIHRLPAVGEAVKRIELQIGGKSRESDLNEETTLLEFSFLDIGTGKNTGLPLVPENGEAVIPLAISAHASGSLTLQNVKVQYQLASEA